MSHIRPLVVSIPVLILKKTQMGLSRKLGLGAFLCLSVTMALIALVRFGGYRIQGTFDPVWQVFWQYVEACVAIIMGSATAFRTLFAGENSRKEPRKKSSYFIRQRLKGKFPLKEDWKDTSRRHLPTVPSPTLLGLRSFIHRHGRSRVGLASQPSYLGTLLSERDDTHVLVHDW